MAGVKQVMRGRIPDKRTGMRLGGKQSCEGRGSISRAMQEEYDVRNGIRAR